MLYLVVIYVNISLYIYSTSYPGLDIYQYAKAYT
jgi:hypothetical protein